MFFRVICYNFRDDYETVIHSNDAIAPVGYLNFTKLRLVDKEVRSEYEILKSSFFSNVNKNKCD